MNIHQVAQLTSVSVRTLHHYDTIGLLQPARNSENGYREYCEQDLDRLQQILFFKECGFPLAVIRQMLDSPNFNREQAFQLQHSYLTHEKQRIETMLHTLTQTQKAWKGEITMTQKEKFQGFDFTQNPYEEEARRRWGDEAVNSYTQKLEKLSPQEQGQLSEKMKQLFCSLAQYKACPPDSAPVQQAMKEMHQFFNSNFGYHYTPQAFAGLGQLYQNDERFTATIDQFGEGLSVFLAKAMQIYADSISS